VRRQAASLALLVALACPAGAAASWADAELARPDEALTRGDLAELVAAVSGEPVLAPARPELRVRLHELDAALVRALGLAPAAAAFQRGARDAGLAPPARLGTEVVARLAGLRTSHPGARGPNDPASRAEAAFSLARALQLGAWRRDWIESLAAGFALPAVTDWQRAVLSRTLGFVGYPYVWGGTADGFDCSGLVWRVYKLEPYAADPEGLLGATLVGRTTYAMSDEGERIPRQSLQPADLVFTGPAGPASKPSEIGHMGIYLGNGWLAHSSTSGVTLVPLAGWYDERVAWGRRPLAEAGLS